MITGRLLDVLRFSVRRFVIIGEIILSVNHLFFSGSENFVIGEAFDSKSNGLENIGDLATYYWTTYMARITNRRGTKPSHW